MLITDFTLKLFDLQQVSFDIIKEDNKNVFIFVARRRVRDIKTNLIFIPT